MRVEKDTIVSLHYKITEPDGTLLEASDGETPFEYFNGSGTLLPFIEASLDGLLPGEERELILPPEKAFGYADQNLKKTIPLNDMKDMEVPLVPGEYITLDDNEEQGWFVDSITDDKIYLDANNPWAGKTLHVHIRVVEVRLPLAGELGSRKLMKNTNVCGPDCCC